MLLVIVGSVGVGMRNISSSRASFVSSLHLLPLREFLSVFRVDVLLVGFCTVRAGMRVVHEALEVFSRPLVISHLGLPFLFLIAFGCVDEPSGHPSHFRCALAFRT